VTNDAKKKKEGGVGIVTAKYQKKKRYPAKNQALRGKRTAYPPVGELQKTAGPAKEGALKYKKTLSTAGKRAE